MVQPSTSYSNCRTSNFTSVVSALDRNPMAPPFGVGKRVAIHGLAALPALNGCTGTVLYHDGATGRLRVRVDPDGKVLAVKADNLREVAELAEGDGAAEVETVETVETPAVAVGVPTVVASGVRAVAGNASAWAVERMLEVVDPEQHSLLGVWQISPRDQSHLVRQACLPLAIPLCWPFAICCAPCVCATAESLRSLHGKTIYALTDRARRWVWSLDPASAAPWDACAARARAPLPFALRAIPYSAVVQSRVTAAGHLWRWIEADPMDASCLGLPFLNPRAYASGSLPLHMIAIAPIDREAQPEMPFERCCPTSELLITVPPGHHLANFKSSPELRYPDTLAMFVEAPDEVAALVRRAQAAAPAPPSAPPFFEIEALMAGVMPQMMERAERTVDPLLIHLEELRELGLITQAEYDALLLERLVGRPPVC